MNFKCQIPVPDRIDLGSGIREANTGISDLESGIWNLESQFPMRIPAVTDPVVFFAAGALVVAYILYMMLRRRAGERPDRPDREPEL